MLFLNTVLLITISSLAHGYVPCISPASHVGSYIGRDQQCAALVQTNCHRPGNRPIGLTSTWKRDVYVKQNCKKIPRFTAIATFLGPNHQYDEPNLHQHTAIFVQCENAGIRVYDQWSGTPIGYRIIPWRGSSSQYSGDNYYTIA